jgi:hypothetical protein
VSKSSGGMWGGTVCILEQKCSLVK